MYPIRAGIRAELERVHSGLAGLNHATCWLYNFGQVPKTSQACFLLGKTGVNRIQFPLTVGVIPQESQGMPENSSSTEHTESLQYMPSIPFLIHSYDKI